MAGGVSNQEDCLRTECAWCGKLIREGREPTSHGMCKECERDYLMEWDERRLAAGKDG